MNIIRPMLLSLAITPLILTGCAERGSVMRVAVDYNQFVVDATNRPTALNILWARDREPLHVTSSTKVDGTISGEAGAGFDPGIKTFRQHPMCVS